MTDEVQTRVLNHLRAEFEEFRRAALTRDMSPEFVAEMDRLRAENARLHEAGNEEEQTVTEGEMLVAITKRLDNIDAKLNLIARSIGGPMLTREWTKLEDAAGVPESKHTFKSKQPPVQVKP